MANSNLDSSPTVSSAIAPPGAVSDFQHTPYYCEENVHLLSKKLCEDGISTLDGFDLFVVFISNEQKQVFHKRMPPEAIDLTSRLLQYHQAFDAKL